MARRDQWLQMSAAAAILSTGFALEGCQSIREATGAIKQPPDEFTVLTKAPLVIPPDYNLRPPQPGAAARNEVDPDQQAQAALFAPSATDQQAALGTNYSDGEKLLLGKSNALVVDPNIRRMVNADAGQDDQGPAFASKVLYEGAKPPPPRVVAAAPIEAAPVENRQGFFGRNLGWLGLGSSEEATVPVSEPVPQPAPQAQIQPAPQATIVAQAQPILPPQQPVAPPVYAPAPQVYAPAPQIAAPAIAPAPQQVYVPAPQAPVLPQQPMVAATPPVQLAAVAPAQAGPAEQPGWFTRNFIMSPKQREALAAGQPLSVVAPDLAGPPQPAPAYAVAPQPVPQYAQQPVPQTYAPQPVPQYASQPAPQPAPAYAVPQQPVPQYVQQQPVLRPTLAAAPPPRQEAKNLYQYLFGVPGQAPAPRAPQQSYAPGGPIQTQPQAQPQPQPQPQAQPQPQQQEDWWSRVFGL